MPKKCFLFGHHDAPQRLLPELERAIETQYTQYGVRDFVVGHYGNFDAMAIQALRKAKQRHEDISLRLLIPYHPSKRRVETPVGFDGTIYPDGMETVPHRAAIVAANRRMADWADTVICYVQHFGNARDLLEYLTRKSEKELPMVENLAEQPDVSNKP